jgi:hypothetical protein
MFFCAERDAHEGSLRARMLPELPAGRGRPCALHAKQKRLERPPSAMSSAA